MKRTLLLLLLAATLRAEMIEADIVVIGGTAGGVSAACTAARLGKKAVLAEYGAHIGGLTSGGLGYTDIGNKAAIGGFARDFYKRLGAHYGKAEAWTFEPSIAGRELRALLAEHKVRVVQNQRVKAVRKEGARIVEAVMEDGNVYRGAVFIDATYEGDLMARAGVSYMVGRESNARFGETLNGKRAETPKHQFEVPVDPYVVPGQPASGLLPFIQDEKPGESGAGDICVQAFNFRLCLTKNLANRLAIEPPPGYDAKQYELLGRYFDELAKAGKKPSVRMFLKIDMVTPEKTDINNNGAFSTDFIGRNYAYPEAPYEERERIKKEHEHYIRGLLVYLATSPRVPEAIRAEMSEWGLCKDEFTDTGGWPHAMYVREARRMIGELVMAEKHCRWLEKPEDAVGLGAYNMDSHNCRRVVVNGIVRNEGDVQAGVRGPYPVAYRAIVPRAKECENLLVPVALSATHIAYGSIRMEPVFMILGQSAATAATMAIDAKTSVQKIDYAKLRGQLLKDGQVLEWDPSMKNQSGGNPGATEGAGSAPAIKLPGLVLDDADGVRTGEWQSGSIVESRRVGTGYIHDGNEEQGAKSIRWTPEIAEAGEYEIVLHFPPNPNRATNALVIIDVNGKATWARVNQQDKAGIATLGSFSLPKGKVTTVTLTNKDANGHVIADGVQLLRK